MPFTALEGPDRDDRPPATIEQNKETGWSFRRVIAALNTMLAELYDAVGTIPAPGSPVQLPEFTFATVPETAPSGAMIYVSDGAAGQPVIAFGDGTDWLRCDTLAAISES